MIRLILEGIGIAAVLLCLIVWALVFISNHTDMGGMP